VVGAREGMGKGIGRTAVRNDSSAADRGPVAGCSSLAGWLLRRVLVETPAKGSFSLARGRDKARQVVRKHRLWETYLITHADVAPGQVDLGADRSSTFWTRK
jgi:hypothetical protein